MRAIVFDGNIASYTDNYPKPAQAAGESLVRVELAAVCSTDREVLRGYRPDFRGVMGHEFCGIVESGDAPELVGRRVVGEINLNCGECLYCASGRPHHCSVRRCLGIADKDGAFADYLTLPNTLLHVVADALPAEQAVFAEPLAAALRITEQLVFLPGDPVAVVGDGRLALMIAQALAAATKARLTVFGRHPQKLALFAPYAKAVCLEGSPGPNGDATTHVDTSRGSIEATPGGLLQGDSAAPAPAVQRESFEVVIDATGSPSSLPMSLALTRSEGTLVIKSTYASLAEFDISEVVVREIRIVGSRCGPFLPAIELLADGRISLPPLELYPPSDYKAAFASRAFKPALDFR